MNDKHLSSDEVLQLVFGELDDTRETAARKAIASDGELADAVRGLEAVVMAVRAENVGQVSGEFNDRLRRRTREVFDQMRAQTVRPAVTTSCSTGWRWIMRHRVSRVAAAAVLVLAIGAVAWWFYGGGTTPAFADFLAPILSARTVTFKSTAVGEGQQSITGKVMVMVPDRMRVEQEMPNKRKMVLIFDKGKTVTLIPDQKLAIVTTYTNVPKGRSSIPFLELRSQLADARNQPDWIREPLGEKEIDGRRLVGYRLTGHGMVLHLWGDPKTGTPVRIETSAPSTPNLKPGVWSDFVFNVDLDESLFSLEPPPGYKVQKQTLDVSPAQEKDLIETFRGYSELRGGMLPDQLDLSAFSQLFLDHWPKSHPTKGGFPSEEEMQERRAGLQKFTRGVSFAFEQLPREADAHYAGKGIKLGAADRPVFWYRPTESKKYRVIYADLSVREADTAPTVPDSQPVVSAAGPKR